MTPEEVLAKAAEDMSEKGMTKGHFYEQGVPGEGWREAPACAYGSMARAMGVTSAGGVVEPGTLDDLDPASEKLAAAIVRLHPDHPVIASLRATHCDDAYDIVTRYNDHEGTTKEDMVLAMKEAAHG